MRRRKRNSSLREAYTPEDIGGCRDWSVRFLDDCYYPEYECRTSDALFCPLHILILLFLDRLYSLVSYWLIFLAACFTLTESPVRASLVDNGTYVERRGVAIGVSASWMTRGPYGHIIKANARESSLLCILASSSLARSLTHIRLSYLRVYLVGLYAAR